MYDISINWTVSEILSGVRARIWGAAVPPRPPVATCLVSSPPYNCLWPQSLVQSIVSINQDFHNYKKTSSKYRCFLWIKMQKTVKVLKSLGPNLQGEWHKVVILYVCAVLKIYSSFEERQNLKEKWELLRRLCCTTRCLDGLRRRLPEGRVSQNRPTCKVNLVK